MYFDGPVTETERRFLELISAGYKFFSCLIGEFFKDGPLYIVKDDRPYSPTVDNPLIQLITIQSTNRLELTWNTDPDEIVHYSWAFDSTNRTVLARPYLTVNHSGVVPRHQGSILTLTCSAKFNTLLSLFVFSVFYQFSTTSCPALE